METDVSLIIHHTLGVSSSTSNCMSIALRPHSLTLLEKVSESGPFP